MSEKSFIKGALILSIAGILGKLLGALYRIPFARIVGEEGVGIYNLAYPLYTLLLALSTAGIPLAISKMIAEREKRQEHGTSIRIFQLALGVLTLIGMTAGVLMFLGADWIAITILGEPRAAWCLKAIAPAMMFTCLMAVFRGYFQGFQHMVPTAVSQVTEQFVRVATIFVALFIMMPYGVEYVAAGASLGAATGGIAGFLLLTVWFISYRKKQSKVPPHLLADGKESNQQLIRQVLFLAIPISIGAMVLPLMQSLDSLLVLGRLKSAGYAHGQALALYSHLSGYAGPIINLPFIITTAIAASLVPAISEAMAAGQKKQVHKQFQSAMLLAIVIVLPAAVGLMTLATAICQLLYDTPEAGVALFWSAPIVLVVGLYQISAAILQGMGKAMVPMWSLLIGATIKGVLTYTLTAIPYIGIRGAAIATILGFFVAAGNNIVQASRTVGWQWFDMTYHVVKPAISVAAMAVGVLVAYPLLFAISRSNGLATLVAIAIGGILYFMVLLFIGGIKIEEIRRIPKVGARIADILIKTKMVRD